MYPSCGETYIPGESEGCKLSNRPFDQEKKGKEKNSAPANNLGEGTTIVKITK